MGLLRTFVSSVGVDGEGRTPGGVNVVGSRNSRAERCSHEIELVRVPFAIGSCDEIESL
jgi:hypothetical protein